MKNLILTLGIPASGKTTWAKQHVTDASTKTKRVNRDDLRMMLDVEQFNPKNEDFITKVQHKIIDISLRSGFDVVVDDTNLNAKFRLALHKIADDIGDVIVLEKAFNTPLSTCLERNAKRPEGQRVPVDVIINMAKKAGIFNGGTLEDRETHYPTKYPFQVPKAQNVSLPQAIICDLDGTLAITGDRSPYDASRCDEVDFPNWPVIQSVKQMYNSGMKIIFMSGRDSKYREQTERFIQKYLSSLPSVDVNHNVIHDGSIPYELYMRSEGDQRKDSVIKKELFEAHVANKYNIFVVYDDRNSVVDLWRSLGLTCFQVGPGNF